MSASAYLLVGMFLVAMRAGADVDRQQIARLRGEGRPEGEILALALLVHAMLILLWPVWLLVMLASAAFSLGRSRP